jgi:hypothetical protein
MKDRLARYRQEHERERERERDRVIAEFDGDMRALASELIFLRRSVGNVAESVKWALAGAPACVIGPGEHWRPRKAPAVRTA